MNRIIALGSHKGGVGKTTTALNLGVALAQLEGRTLLLDLDPEAGLTMASNVRQRSPLGLINVLKGECAAIEALLTSRHPSLALVPFGRPSAEDAATLSAAANDGRLVKLIQEFTSGFDRTIIDAPSGLSPVASAVLAASHQAIAVVNCQAITLKAVAEHLKLVQNVRETANPQLKLAGILISMFDRRSQPQRTLLKEVRALFPEDIVFDTIIPYAEAIESASLRSVPVALVAHAPEIASLYYRLALELRSRETETTPESPDEDPARLF